MAFLKKVAVRHELQSFSGEFKLYRFSVLTLKQSPRPKTGKLTFARGLETPRTSSVKKVCWFCVVGTPRKTVRLRPVATRSTESNVSPSRWKALRNSQRGQNLNQAPQ